MMQRKDREGEGPEAGLTGACDAGVARASLMPDGDGEATSAAVADGGEVERRAASLRHLRPRNSAERETVPRRVHSGHREYTSSTVEATVRQGLTAALLFVTFRRLGKQKRNRGEKLVAGQGEREG